MIFVAFVISGIVIIASLGGFGNAVNQVQSFTERATSGEFGAAMLKSFTGNKTFGTMSAVSAFSWCLGYFGMPHIIIRFMGIRSNGEIKKSRRIGIIWMIISYIGAVLIGALGTAYLLNKGIILGADPSEVTTAGLKVLGTGTQEAVFSESILRIQ